MKDDRLYVAGMTGFIFYSGWVRECSIGEGSEGNQKQCREVEMVDVYSFNSNTVPYQESATSKEDPKKNEVASTNVWEDKETVLTWQVSPPKKALTWDAANLYCSSLILGNLSGWRLPSKDELLSLIRKDGYGCQWPSELKGRCSRYWSSSSNEDLSEGVWTVYFEGGFESSDSKTNDSFVRCVRSATAGQ